jgi:hypothetical protein
MASHLVEMKPQTLVPGKVDAIELASEQCS